MPQLQGKKEQGDQQQQQYGDSSQPLSTTECPPQQAAAVAAAALKQGHTADVQREGTPSSCYQAGYDSMSASRPPSSMGMSSSTVIKTEVTGGEAAAAGKAGVGGPGVDKGPGSLVAELLRVSASLEMRLKGQALIRSSVEQSTQHQQQQQHGGAQEYQAGSTSGDKQQKGQEQQRQQVASLQHNPSCQQEVLKGMGQISNECVGAGDADTGAQESLRGSQLQRVAELKKQQGPLVDAGQRKGLSGVGNSIPEQHLSPSSSQQQQQQQDNRCRKGPLQEGDPTEKQQEQGNCSIQGSLQGEKETEKQQQQEQGHCSIQGSMQGEKETENRQQQAQHQQQEQQKEPQRQQQVQQLQQQQLPPPVPAPEQQQLCLETGSFKPDGPAAGQQSGSSSAGLQDVDSFLNTLLSEVQQLSVMRQALKSEFEALGHGAAVAGLQTLTKYLHAFPEVQQHQQQQQERQRQLPQRPGEQQQQLERSTQQPQEQQQQQLQIQQPIPLRTGSSAAEGEGFEEVGAQGYCDDTARQGAIQVQIRNVLHASRRSIHMQQEECQAPKPEVPLSEPNTPQKGVPAAVEAAAQAAARIVTAAAAAGTRGVHRVVEAAAGVAHGNKVPPPDPYTSQLFPADLWSRISSSGGTSRDQTAAMLRYTAAGVEAKASTGDSNPDRFSSAVSPSTEASVAAAGAVGTENGWGTARAAGAALTLPPPAAAAAADDDVQGGEYQPTSKLAAQQQQEQVSFRQDAYSGPLRRHSGVMLSVDNPLFGAISQEPSCEVMLPQQPPGSEAEPNGGSQFASAQTAGVELADDGQAAAATASEACVRGSQSNLRSTLIIPTESSDLDVLQSSHGCHGHQVTGAELGSPPCARPSGGGGGDAAARGGDDFGDDCGRAGSPLVVAGNQIKAAAVASAYAGDTGVWPINVSSSSSTCIAVDCTAGGSSTNSSSLVMPRPASPGRVVMSRWVSSSPIARRPPSPAVAMLQSAATTAASAEIGNAGHGCASMDAKNVVNGLPGVFRVQQPALAAALPSGTVIGIPVVGADLADTAAIPPAAAEGAAAVPYSTAYVRPQPPSQHASPHGAGPMGDPYLQWGGQLPQQQLQPQHHQQQQQYQYQHHHQQDHQAQQQQQQRSCSPTVVYTSNSPGNMAHPTGFSLGQQSNAAGASSGGHGGAAAPANPGHLHSGGFLQRLECQVGSSSRAAGDASQRCQPASPAHSKGGSPKSAAGKRAKELSIRGDK